MALIGSRAAFTLEEYWTSKRCGECNTSMKPGDVVLVSRDKHNRVAKVVCSEPCREEFDARLWQMIADRNEHKRKLM